VLVTTLALPGVYSIRRLYGWSSKAQGPNRPLGDLSDINHRNGWWLVMMTAGLLRGNHGIFEQTIRRPKLLSRSLSSFFSGDFSSLLAYSMGFSSGPSPWNNAAPNAHELASARRVYGLPGSACRKTGAVVKALFNVSNACSWEDPQSQAVSFLVGLVNGRAISANLGINRRYELQVCINVSNKLFNIYGWRRPQDALDLVRVCLDALWGYSMTQIFHLETSEMTFRAVHM
jgi:hypothetical protein